MENNGNKLIIPAIIVLGGSIVLYILTRSKPQQSQQTPQLEPGLTEPTPITTPEPIPITTPRPKFTPIPISVPINGQLSTLLQLDKLEYRFIDPSRPPIPIAFTQIQPGDTLTLQQSVVRQLGTTYFCSDQQLFVRFALQNLSNVPQNVKLSVTARSIISRTVGPISPYAPGLPRDYVEERLANIGEVETTINKGEAKIFEFCTKSKTMQEWVGLNLKSSEHVMNRNAGDGDILLNLEVAGQKPLDKYVLLKWKYSEKVTCGIRFLSQC